MALKITIVSLLCFITFGSGLAGCCSNCCAQCPNEKPHIPSSPKPKPPKAPTYPPYTPSKPMPPAPYVAHKCPVDALKLGACADLLGGLVSIIIGTPPSSECCSILGGLTDLDAALCLCTAIRANVLGINLNVPVTLSAVVSGCRKTIPPGFECP